MLKTLFHKYKHGLLFLYGLIYFPWFAYLNNHATPNKQYHIIHLTIDDQIPFIKYFVIPYLMWFFYVAATIIFFFFKDKIGFFKYCISLFIGMTVFLIFSSFYPNGQDLRPESFATNDIFIQLIKQVYKADMPVNIFPSIHVFNSLCTHNAILKNSFFKQHKWIQYLSLILMTCIILATVFIKQHSVLDIIGGIILFVFVYLLIYKKNILFRKQKTSL